MKADIFQIYKGPSFSGFWLMVFNASFNNISVLLMEETGVLGENHRPVESHGQTLSHNVVSSTPPMNGVRTHNFNGERH